MAKSTVRANKQVGNKVCSSCTTEKKIIDFYYSASPMHNVDNRVPFCKDCCKSYALTVCGEIDYSKLYELLRFIDKPLYYDLLWTATNSIREKYGFIDDVQLRQQGMEILGEYFRLIAMKQDRAKRFGVAEKENFVHRNTTRTPEEIREIIQTYEPLFFGVSKKTNVSANEQNTNVYENISDDNIVYSDVWIGNYSESDIKKLDHYYESLENDYNIVTENHRDYARKIAKASLQMDKAFDDMMNGVEGADKKYENATKAFDLLSKSAKFSESTRSVNDVGASSFSKVAAMIENHNWIPEHKPMEKDEIDKLIDYLSTITKSV